MKQHKNQIHNPISLSHTYIHAIPNSLDSLFQEQTGNTHMQIYNLQQ